MHMYTYARLRLSISDFRDRDRALATLRSLASIIFEELSYATDSQSIVTHMLVKLIAHRRIFKICKS